jgi:hypothetical protein
MHHFKYNLEKKEILAKRQDYFDELNTLKNDLEKFTNTALNEVALIQKLKEANEILNELTFDNYSEYKKQESEEWVDIKNATKNNSELCNRLLLKRKDNKSNIDSINERIKLLEKIVEYGDSLFEKLNKLDDEYSKADQKKDYHPILKSNTINEISVSRGAIIINCFTKGNLQPFGFKKAITYFEYLDNSNKLCFENDVKIKVDNEFLKKIDFMCDYLDLNNPGIYNENDNAFFPVSPETLKVFDLHTTDVGFDDNSFEFNLSLINHEIHESYNSYILNCPFRLRLLIDFILSYNR